MERRTGGFFHSYGDMAVEVEPAVQMDPEVPCGGVCRVFGDVALN